MWTPILACLATFVPALVLTASAGFAEPFGERARASGASAPLLLAADRDRPGEFDRGDRGRDRVDRGPDRGGDSDWQLLGSVRVGGLGVDHDVVDVGRREGRFEKIGVTAREGSAFLIDLVVVYANGEREQFDLHQHLRQGERTPPVDLKGRARPIKRIEVTSRAGRESRGRAVLDVFAQEARGGDNWELLGKQSVGFGVDHDVIRVGRREGRFEKIALEASDNDVEILDLKVFFFRGPPQDVSVREKLRRGTRTRPLDLAGGDRGIDRIELTYRSKPNFRGNASVAVYGLQSSGGDRPGFGGPPPGADWVELGCSKTGFLPDHDTIKVGRQDGRFSAIKLRVTGNKVHILNLRVIYERGGPDDIPVRSEIREGGETGPLDLRGERRAINQVELYTQAQLSLKGSARVCVLGRQ